MSKIIKGVTYEGTQGSQIFDQLIVKSIENANLTEMYKNYKSSLYFTETPILGPNDLYSSYDPGMGLPETGELEKAPEIERRFGNTKGIYQKKYTGKISVTGDFYDWMKTTNTLEGANSDIQAQVFRTRKNVKFLMQNGEKTKSQILVKVLTLGNSISAAKGPGSATPDGQALFSATHPIIGLGTTQSNIQTGVFTTDADKITALTGAVNKLRTMRLHNGDYVRSLAGVNEPFVLKCPVDQTLAWKRALNANMKYSGQGNNSNAVNMFEVSDFMVIIEELPLLGTYDYDKNMIGDTTSVYLMNPVYLRETQALRCYTIKELSIVTEDVKDPRSYVAYAEAKFGADHYGAELGIVKLTGLSS